MELSGSAGLVLDPWQCLSLEVILGERGDGRWAAFETGEVVARQNGKGGVIEALELAGLFLLGEKLILHSAHEFKTAAEAFLRIKTLIEQTDELIKLCKKPRTSHGEESIERLNGQRLRFVARSRSSGRGFSGDRVVLDEAQELPRAAMGALLPTLSARPNPQVNYFGTVPSAENDAEHWESLRDRGRAGDDSSLAWLEWSPGADPRHVDLDDREAWAQANPALGYRITEETIQRERNSLGDDEFGRERLSLWGSATGRATALDFAKWMSLIDPRSQPRDPVAFAVEVTRDRAWASIGIAGRRDDGSTHLEVVEFRRGTGWVAGRLDALVKKWKPCATVLNAGGPAGALLRPLSDLGVEVTPISAREMGQACGAVYDEVTDDAVRHLDQPALNTAVGSARKRTVGDAWVWDDRDPNVNVAPLGAVTWASWGLTIGKSKRSGKVW